MDSENNLNVYHTAAENETSCCGPAAEKVPSGCGQNKAGCGSDSSAKENTLGSESKKLAASLDNLDFNEWAGMIILTPQSLASCLTM